MTIKILHRCQAASDEHGSATRYYEVGDVVETKYGLCKIKKIEIMPEPRHSSKCGINVNKMFTSLLNYCIIDLDNNHFVYGDEVNNGNN